LLRFGRATTDLNWAVYIVVFIMPAVTSSLLENWKCLLACTLVSMSPFQYGIDFGAIGGLQAMKGFLQVSEFSLNRGHG
jgi:hypothetical protein